MKRILIMMGLMLSSCAVMAETAVVDGITWTYSFGGGKASIGSGAWQKPSVSKSTEGAIIIPSTLGGYPVTSINSYAFYGCKGLTSVTIPEGVTSIGAEAFYGCRGLTSITIPSSVVSIGTCAFQYCSVLMSVTIPSGVTSIGYRVFDGCSGLTSVTIPESVKSIGEHAFCDCNGLTDVTIPESVTSIGDGAFVNSGLTSVTIPQSVTSIGDSAFSGCKGLMSFTVDAGNLNYKSSNGLLLSEDGKTLIAGVNGNVTIPSSVSSIGDSAFRGCGGLTSVTIPSSVTSIGEYAFYFCKGLTSVTIPEGVTSIAEDAFGFCYGLTSVTIPSSVTSIGYEAFYYCNRLTSVTISDGVTGIGSSAFSNCSALKSVTIPSSVTSVSSCAFYNCSELTNIVFGGNSPTCGANAYQGVKSGCTATVKWGTCGWDDDDDGKWQGLKLNYVDKPKPIMFTVVGYTSTYDGMGHGITVTVSDPDKGAVVTYALTKDGDYVAVPILFTNVTDGAQSVYFKIAAENYFATNGMATVTITPKPDGGPYMEAIGETQWTYTISGGMASVTEANPTTGAITIPSTLGGCPVTNIGERAFYDCDGMTSVTIPGNVKNIGPQAFAGCSSLKDVYLEGDTIDMFDTGAFADCHWDLIMHVPSIWKGRGKTMCGYTVSREGENMEPQVVNLVITNIVIHYIQTSEQSPMTAPITQDVGLVNVMTEIKGGNVAIPETWTDNYPTFKTKFGNDFTAALTRTTGKTDAAGNPMTVWQDFVAGTDPTDEESVFRASVTMVDGKPIVSYTPELTAEEKAKRKYTTYGKVKLQDEKWVEVPSGSEADYNFFKVTVEMK